MGRETSGYTPRFPEEEKEPRSSFAGSVTIFKVIDLSIIIINYNDRRFLEDCLGSICKNTHKVNFEIIFVDNGSNDDSVNFVRSNFPKVHLIQNQSNLGFCRANNQGFQIYQGRYALLLNADTVIKENTLDQMVEFMDANPKAGACGAKLLNPDGTIQHQGGLLASRFWTANRPKEVKFVVGAALMARREVIEKIGGLDENFFFANDDLDWCLRIRKAGWKIYFLSQAQIIHHGGFTTKRFSQRLFVEGFRGGLYFAKKHYGIFAYQVYRFLLVLLLLAALPYSLIFDRKKTGAYLEILKICLQGKLTPFFSPSLIKRGGRGVSSILFLTNGHSEDLVAAEISKQLGKDFTFSTLSLVDKTLPSGGFSLRNFRFLIQDISAGLFGKTMENIRTLKKLRGQVALTVAVGDIIPIIGALIVKAPFIFVGVNKSDHYRWFGYSYTPWEKWLLKKYAKKIYVRDHFTADNLNRQGILAEYVGNPLMDCLTPSLRSSPLLRFDRRRGVSEQSEDGVRIGFLPGTREDAKLNLEDFEKVVEELINLKDSDTRFKFLIATTLPDIPEYMEGKPFAEVLAEADLIVGLSGTGNEQAAGCGIPVVSFYGRGAQYHKKFARAQKQLLGDALNLVESRDPKLIALHIWRLLKDPDKMKEMGEAGKIRMGKGGAAEKIAAEIIRCV